MYVWIDAVLGYLTDTMRVCEERGWDWEDFWKEGRNNKIYMCHGKDNIVFHTIIFPALLTACKQNFFLPNVCVATEFMNINGEKISKSKGNGWPMLQMLEKFDPDSLRLFVISNGPERKDSNFTFEDYHSLHNGEIVNKYANFVNRTLNYKGLEGFIPAGQVDEEIKTKVEQTFKLCGKAIEATNFREAVSYIFDLTSEANKYYDTKQPWILAKNEDKTEFNNVIATCVYLIANLATLFEPFMPFSSKKVKDYLGITTSKWEAIDFSAGKNFGKFEPLFKRLTKDDVL